MLRIGVRLRRRSGRFGRRRGDRAEDVVEPAALDPQAGDRPAALAGEIGDLGDDRAAVAREDDQPVALARR